MGPSGFVLGLVIVAMVASPVSSFINTSTSTIHQPRRGGAVAMSTKVATPPAPPAQAFSHTPMKPLGDDVFDPQEIKLSCPNGMALDEWAARVHLAAMYRIFYARGWDEEIFNHITIRLPGPHSHFLINPYGLNYDEVTASNLIKIDLVGNKIPPGEGYHLENPYGVNKAGFVIHSAVHRAREDARVIIHTHSTAVSAVAQKEGGLPLDNFYSQFLYGKVAYHDFEGVTVREGEKERLVKNLGDKTVMVLRNHGVLIAEKSLANAFFTYFAVQRACEIATMAAAIPGPNIPINKSILENALRSAEATDSEGKVQSKVFGAAIRRAKLTLQDLL